MADSYIHLPDDSFNDGKKKHTKIVTIGADETHNDCVVLQAMPSGSSDPIQQFGGPVSLMATERGELRVSLGNCFEFFPAEIDSLWDTAVQLPGEGHAWDGW